MQQFYTDADPLMQRVHDALCEQVNNGLVGVIATRSRISENALVDWSRDVSQVLTAGELHDLAQTLGIDEELHE
jgi:hypothetical protein